MTTTEMHTGRLCLKPLNDSFVSAVYALTSDPEVAQYMHFDTHTDISQADELIQKLTSGANRSYAVFDREDAFVGVFALKPDEKQPELVTMSAFLGRAYWGQGYCTEVTQLAVDTAREKLGAKKLLAFVVSKNKASCRVLEKTGFAVERELSFHDCTVLVFSRELV